MPKAIISKDVLDTLIRAKAASVPRCKDVTPMPVRWSGNGNGCNWEVPGWTGENGAVQQCIEDMRQYMAILRAQFDIAAPEER